MAITSRTVNYFPSETMNPLSHIVLPEKTFVQKVKYLHPKCVKRLLHILLMTTLDYGINSTGYQ